VLALLGTILSAWVCTSVVWCCSDICYQLRPYTNIITLISRFHIVDKPGFAILSYLFYISLQMLVYSTFLARNSHTVLIRIVEIRVCFPVWMGRGEEKVYYLRFTHASLETCILHLAIKYLHTTQNHCESAFSLSSFVPILIVAVVSRRTVFSIPLFGSEVV
jgi:hypothetical protein